MDAGGQTCYRYCTSAASGSRSMMTSDQAFILMVCIVGVGVFLTAAILDVIKWREDEAKRRK